MRVLLFGATGMVGRGVLLECLDDPAVDDVLVIGRRPCGLAHAKLREQLQSDFQDFSTLGGQLQGVDACLFCLGVSAAGLSEAEYTRLTLDLTLAAARAVLEQSPRAAFCYVSGQGTDSTERGRLMWARIKGRTENALLGMPFRGVWIFRPGLIQPLRGVRSRTRLYQAFYSGLGWSLPLLRRCFPRQITSTVDLARAMLRAAREGAPESVLETWRINELARAESARRNDGKQGA
ncbi:MAG: epimerase [Candidatus Delongbacteria bacterium]